MIVVNGIREILKVKDYDGILLDQFGVVHDGKEIYPGALDAIRRISLDSRNTVILSNSSRKASRILTKLAKMGVAADWIKAVITSGQIAHDNILQSAERYRQMKILHFNWSPDRGSIDLREYGISTAKTDFCLDQYSFPDPKSVDLVIAHGTSGITLPDNSVRVIPYEVLEEYCKLLATAQPNVPLLCANPDLVTVEGDALRPMPGKLVAAYEEAGGTAAIRLGKPDPVAYHAAISILRKAGSSRFLAIGDSVAHDILGAANSSLSIDSVYIAGGIDADSYRIKPSDGFKNTTPSWNWDPKILDAIIARDAPSLGDRRPAYVMPFLRW